MLINILSTVLIGTGVLGLTLLVIYLMVSIIEWLGSWDARETILIVLGIVVLIAFLFFLGQVADCYSDLINVMDCYLGLP